MNPIDPNPIPEIDPVDDRDEFARRLKQSSCWRKFYSTEEVLDAVVSQDDEKLAEIRALKTACEEHNNKLLQDYDAASDRNGKAAVVGSVKAYEPR